MKKFFKMLMMTLVLLPCMIFGACFEKPPADPDNGTGTGTGTGGGSTPTQAEINAEGFAKFKTVMPAFLDHTGSKTVTNVSSQVQSTKLLDANKVELGQEAYEEIMGPGSYEEAEMTETTKTVETYNPTTGEYAYRTYVANATDEFVADTDNYAFIKKVGTDYINYLMEDGVPEANYVSSDHVVKVGFEQSLWCPESEEGDASVNPESFSTFDDMVDYMGDLMRENMGEGVEDIVFDVNGLFIENQNDWALKMTFSLEGEDAGDAVAMYAEMKIVFTDTDVLSYSNTSSMSMTMPLALPGVPEGTTVAIVYTMEMDETFSKTFDSTIAMSAADEAEFDGVTPVPAEVFIHFTSNLGENSFMSKDYTYGDSVADILDNLKAELGDNVDFTLYRDEAMTVEYDYTTETAPSYDMHLYLKVTPKEGYALVVESRSLTDVSAHYPVHSEEVVTVVAVATDGTYTYLTGVDFADDNGVHDSYDGEAWDSVTVNGEERGSAATITLESGSVYLISYVKDHLY